MMNISPIASGSNGNCTYVETTSAKLLIDVGISFKELSKRMEGIGRDVNDVDACLVTHEHSDHIRGVGVISRKLGIPVYMNKKTYQNSIPVTNKIDNIKFFESGDSVEFGNTLARSFTKPHDAADPVSFVIEDRNKSFGVMTDTGFACDNTKKNFAEVNSIMLESNYDPSMLSSCGYPAFLKKRISGKLGHLSNEEAGLLALENATKKLKSVFLGHLSANSNTPEIVYETFNSIISSRKDLKKVKVNLASRYGCIGIYRV